MTPYTISRQQVLELHAQGLTPKQIANKLYVNRYLVEQVLRGVSPADKGKAATDARKSRTNSRARFNREQRKQRAAAASSKFGSTAQGKAALERSNARWLARRVADSDLLAKVEGDETQILEAITTIRSKRVADTSRDLKDLGASLVRLLGKLAAAKVAE
jgi:hypothetical protein